MDFNNTGGMRSPFSPRIKQARRPIGLASAKKAPSNYMQSPGGQQTGDVIYKTPSMTLETFGLPLPVMVTEALTFASGDVSARMSACGWCWVVAGRRVLTWPYQPALAAAARELTLPQTDLAHKANLVVLFYDGEAQLPSCIGVSPEGVVRYWPCIGQEGVYVDISAELAGQECEQLGEPTKSGLVLATTTCTVVLLTPTMTDGRPTVTCQTLRPPSGWLGGIGRRVSLLFFGSMPAHAETKLVGVVVLSGRGPSEGGGPEQQGECVALVASGPLLQLWRGAELHEHHLRRPLCDALARAHLAPQVDLNSLEIMALDVHPSGPNSLMLLIASVNVARSPERRYAIANVDVEEAHNPRVTSLQPLQALQPPTALQAPQSSLQPDAEPEEPPRCLPLPPRALLYTSSYVALVPAVGAGGGASGEGGERLALRAEGDVALGAALCGGAALLFSRRHGLLALRTPRPQPDTHQLSTCESPVGSPGPADMYDGNLSMYEIDPHEVLPLASDPLDKLKVAFLFHVRRDPAAARLLAEEFGAGGAGGGAGAGERVDAPLDVAAAGAARSLLDDAPAGDPRWRGARRPRLALGASAALQLAAQLRDKAQAFALFLDFLRAHGLWRRLASVSRESGDGVVGTQQLLGAYGERLAAARALRRLQEEDPEGAPLLEAACQRLARDEPEAELLPAADVAFRRVSRAERLLRALAQAAPPAPDARAAAAHAAAALRLLAEASRAAQAWRAQWAAAGGPPPPAPPLDPATRPALAHLHTRALTECARGCPDATLRARLLEAAAALADQLLADARAQPGFDALRRQLLRPYVDLGQGRRAAALAEKFQDYELLVELCVADNDMERLHGYIEKYSDQGIAEIAFAWLASGDGAAQALLVRELGARGGERLARWLSAAPEPRRAQLLALQQLGRRRPHAAAAALASLARLEQKQPQPLSRTTTMASLAKLCLAAAEEEQPQLRGELERRLALCEQQAELPAALRPSDAQNAPLMSPAQLLELYIDSESEPLTEYDYKKALDLTEMVEDLEEREDLKLQVWDACAARERWAEAAAAPRDSLLYRLAELVHLMGGDVRQWLPPLPALLAGPKLAPLLKEARALFALKLAYEHVHEELCQRPASPAR